MEETDQGEEAWRDHELLSREEAFKFLPKIGVVDGEDLRAKDQLAFLNAILAGFMTHIPMQSVSMLAVRLEERRVPSLRELVEAGLSLEGGVCFTLNTFMCILLRALDLHAHVLDGSYTAAAHLPHNHVVILVKGLRYPGDDFIVDVGSGYPFFEAVPLAGLPATYQQAGLEYTYTRQGDTVARLHHVGDDRPDNEQSVMVGEWRKVFHFNLTPVGYDFFNEPMEYIYINDQSPCLMHIRAIRFPQAKLVSGIADATDNNQDVQDGSMPQEASTNDDKQDIYEPLTIGSCKDLNEATQTSDTPNSEKKSQKTLSGKASEHGTDRVLLAIRNQSLLVGPMCQVVKTKVEEMVWSDHIKQHFPNIPPYKVDLAVHAMLASQTTP